ncbi:MAG: hypothetical protein LBT54_04025, partial [Bifidobacteriaceae bacterium]|nr:hypothetical protein [Bifidobacteriaceae bacterium]
MLEERVRRLVGVHRGAPVRAGIGPARLDGRRFWDAMDRLDPDRIAGIEERIAGRALAGHGVDPSALILDTADFATYIATANGAAPIAQRGKAKQKRSDLRLVGLGLVAAEDGAIPILSHPYPGNKPDAAQFPQMATRLASRHAVLGD